MVVETDLPFSFCESKIHFFRQWSCYVTFMYYIINLKVRSHWAFCFFSAISFWCFDMCFRSDFFVSLDDFWHIVHVTVADFNCTAIENFVKFLVPLKMFCYQLKECVCNTFWNGFAQGWVKPFYVLLSRFCFFWFVVGVF